MIEFFSECTIAVPRYNFPALMARQRLRRRFFCLYDIIFGQSLTNLYNLGGSQRIQVCKFSFKQLVKLSDQGN
jgi:hypothetical protein